METLTETWSTEANEALTLHFVSNSEQIAESKGVPPEFTHQIFGDSEKIVGFKNPRIQIYFSAASLAPFFQFKFDKKATARDLEDVEPTNVSKELTQWIPDFTTNRSTYEQLVDQEQAKFKPVGTKITEYKLETEENIVYEIYKGDGDSVDVQRYHQRVQPLSIFFIEAASYIDDFDRWEFFYTFAKEKHSDGKASYKLVGFVTCYRFYFYHRQQPDMGRLRIGQFLILPPFQKRNHGAKLYEVIARDVLNRKDVADLTVEGPTPQFQRMRDLCDLSYVWSQHKQLAQSFKIPLDPKSVQQLRQLTKFSKHQSFRCAEIFLLRNLRAGGEDQQAYKEYLKKRLARDNELTMASAKEKEQQTAQLDALYEEEIAQYRSLLQKAALV